MLNVHFQAFFPALPDPSAETMNWSCLIFGAMVAFGLIFYVTKKRHEYQGPVVLVRKEEDIDMQDYAR